MTIIGQDLGDIQKALKMDPSLLSTWHWELLFARWAKGTIYSIPLFKKETFINLLLKKNAIYGDAPIKKWGELGVAIRISSKYERYLNLNKLSLENWDDESLIDTMMDIIGYCVLGIIYVRSRAHGDDFWLEPMNIR